MLLGLDLRAHVISTWQAPSTGAKHENMRLSQTPQALKAVYNGRPPKLTGPPISVYHPVFAEFLQQIQRPLDLSTFTPGDLAAAQRLAEVTAVYHKDEAHFQTAVATGLEQFFPPGVNKPKRITWGDTHCEPDGYWETELLRLYRPLEPGRSAWLKMIEQMKLGIGTGGCDPINQGEKDYLFGLLNPHVCFSPILLAQVSDSLLSWTS